MVSEEDEITAKLLIIPLKSLVFVTVYLLLPTVIPLQLLSYHIALLKNCNVDQPRNLAKSVTVE